MDYNEKDMVRYLRLIFQAILFTLILLLPFEAVHAEEIQNFQSEITINSDGSLDVSERITYDFEDLVRHGIFRTLPLVKTNSEGKKFKMTIDTFSVVDENTKVLNYSLSTDQKAVTLKIGDADKSVSGVHTYVIRYHVLGALTYFSDHDELYWNVTGNEWTVPIVQASSLLHLPGNIEPVGIRMSCFTGVVGSLDHVCRTQSDTATVEITSDTVFSDSEGLTIVVGFPKNLVAVVNPQTLTDFSTTPLGKLFVTIGAIISGIFIFAWYIGLPGFIIFHWWRSGRDPKSPTGVAHVWFDIPKSKSLRKFTPGEIGALVDEQVDMRDITSTIVDLATRGYLKIIEKKKNEFFLAKLSPPETSLQPHERLLYDGLFTSGGEVDLKKGEFVGTVNKSRKQLYESLVSEHLFDKNPDTTRSLYYILAFIALVTGNVPLTIVSFIFGHNMPRKTLFGAQSATIAQALKHFIVSQKDQLTYQAKNQMFFEKMLPFAVAFGVEKIWAKRFADIALKEPDWYQGSSYGTFNSIIFTNSLVSSLSRFSTAATPTRSSSGFSSGFSGGSSGGGGGGGGGGSW